jgi:ABC-2 type transport system ATP-binding protein
MLEVRGLTKLYTGIPAIENVSFVARRCEVTGYLGPNGSGKSTTIKIITGLLKPTDGDVYYRGERVAGQMVEFKRLLGYVPEEPHLYTFLSGFEYLELTGGLRGVPPGPLKEKINEFLRLFSLYEDRHSPMSSYSKGMRQKVLIASALLHNPELVILDEPFSGLDVSSALIMRRFIQSLAEANKIVLYSSHVLEVVEKICAKVVILHKGKVVADDSVTRLRDLMELPSLESIFSQLAVEQDTDGIAAELIDVMQR